MRNKFRLPGIMMLLLVCNLFNTGFLTGCSEKKGPPKGRDSVFVPYQEFENSTLYFYDDKVKLWKLECDYIRKTMGDTSHMLGVPVRLEVYDSAGNTASKIWADSGITSSSMDSFFIWSNVYILRHDSLNIRSSSLWWQKDRHKVGSEDFVEITTPSGDILRGKGLDATETFSSWELRESVSGEFPKFKKRMVQDDKEE